MSKIEIKTSKNVYLLVATISITLASVIFLYSDFNNIFIQLLVCVLLGLAIYDYYRFFTMLRLIYIIRNIERKKIKTDKENDKTR